MLPSDDLTALMFHISIGNIIDILELVPQLDKGIPDCIGRVQNLVLCGVQLDIFAATISFENSVQRLCRTLVSAMPVIHRRYV